ncbi:MAG: alpha-1,6-mannosyltransferase [Algoriphagus sp.]|jgi:alpha-1,6-mannosyltransferase
MSIALKLFSALFYFLLIFSHRDRGDFWFYFWLMAFLFALYLYDVIKSKSTPEGVWFWAIVLRGIFIVYLPVLSDDVYRFIWDGYLSLSGQNPYLFLPVDYSGPMLEGLFNKLNSPNYYSLYPPLKQYFFAVGVFIGNGSIIQSVFAMRFILFLGSMLNIYLLFKIAEHHNYSKTKRNKIVTLYAFNPFIIMETIGNLHFEGLMLSLLLLTYYIYVKWNYTTVSAISFAMAVSVKLIPLILLPLIWVKFGWVKGFKFVFMVGVINIALFLPFLERDIFLNVLNSLDLYFHRFEFNAGLYYLLREVGFFLFGYNLIAIIGPLLAVSSLILILKRSFSREGLVESSLFILFVYLLCSTTVHPWYIIILFGVSLFSNYRFPLVWTITVGLSYQAYASFPVNENLVLVAIEFSIVVGVFLWEYINKRALFSLD